MTIREFYRPDGELDDKAWLYDSVLTFIAQMNNHERAYTGKKMPRTERSIYNLFAPLSGTPFLVTRPSWEEKSRKVKRAMLAAVLKRLIEDGKIRVCGMLYPNLKSMNGREVSQRKSDTHLFGSDHDGVIRSYDETNALQAIADALGEHDA